MSDSLAFFFSKIVFLYVFHSCPPFLCQIVYCSCHSLRSRSFVKSNHEWMTQVALNKRAIISDSLLSILAQVARDKRATGGIHSFSQANRSFALSLFCSQIRNQSLEKTKSQFPILVFSMQRHSNKFFIQDAKVLHKLVSGMQWLSQIFYSEWKGIQQFSFL